MSTTETDQFLTEVGLTMIRLGLKSSSRPHLKAKHFPTVLDLQKDVWIPRPTIEDLQSLVELIHNPRSEEVARIAELAIERIKQDDSWRSETLSRQPAHRV